MNFLDCAMHLHNCTNTSKLDHSGKNDKKHDTKFIMKTDFSASVIPEYISRATI